MKFKNIAELAIALKSSEAKVREVVAANSIALQDIDDTLLEALRSELAESSISVPIKGSEIAPKKTESEIAPVVPSVPAMKAIGKEGIQKSQQRKAESTTDVMTATSDAHSNLMDRTLEKFNEKVAGQTEELSDKMSDVLAQQTFSQFEAVADFFGVKMNSTDDFIQSIQDAIAVEATVIED